MISVACQWHVLLFRVLQRKRLEYNRWENLGRRHWSRDKERAPPIVSYISIRPRKSTSEDLLSR